MVVYNVGDVSTGTSCRPIIVQIYHNKFLESKQRIHVERLNYHSMWLVNPTSLLCHRK